MNIVAVENLSKSYSGNKVVKDISFNVKKGEVFSILGPNGAGKTTTLEMMEGLRPIDSGTILLDKTDVAKDVEAVKRKIGVQLQTSAFFEKLSLTELLKLFGSLYGHDVDAAKLLDSVNLTSKSKADVKSLSGGQKQRFSIAAAMVNQPKVLFLDEPTTGLDPQARRNLWDLIQKIQADGVTIVLTTHYMDEAEILSDRIAVMDEGKIVAMDTPEGLIDALLDKGFKKKVQRKQADLEDVFLDLTGKDLRE